MSCLLKNCNISKNNFLYFNKTVMWYYKIQLYYEEPKKNNFYTDNVIIEEIKKYEEKLNETGRIVIRPSGTEPLIRVMIEGENEKIIKEYAQKLADFIKGKMN